MKSILNPDFKYVHSSHTTVDHLREVFAKARREIEAQKAPPVVAKPHQWWPTPVAAGRDKC